MAGISPDKLASAVMKQMDEYGNLAAAEVKTAVRRAGKTVKEQIEATAPVRSGKYAKSWRAKPTRETADALEVTVHSPRRYMLAHLLEKGHAKRGGGRTRAFPHIRPAEEAGIEQLEDEIRKALKG